MRYNFYSFINVEEENIILKSWLEQKKNFTDNLIASRKRPTKDSVHDLRVAVKKMRSYLRLNEHLNGEEWKASFLKISSLFKLCGRLRDFDMSLFWLRKYERTYHLPITYFKEYLSVNRSLFRKWLKQAAINFNEEELENLKPQFKFGLPHKELAKKIIHTSAIKIEKAKNLSKHFHKNAHGIRKELKDVFYWLKICPEEMADSRVNHKSLTRLLSFLGRWQDLFMLRKKIKQFEKSLPKKDEEKAILKILEKHLETVQQEILDKADRKLKAIENNKQTYQPL